MKDIILNILPENYKSISDQGLSVHDTTFNWSIFTWDNTEKISDFYLFLNLSAKDFISLHSTYSQDVKITETILKEQWIYEIKRKIVKQYIVGNTDLTDRDWEKNITLIIVLDCTQYDPRLEEESSKSLFDFEENPYSFRKNILFYKDEELTAFNAEVKEKKLIDSLDEIILSKDYFSAYKNDKNSLSLIYSLVSQLYVKIPFLNLPASNNIQQLNNLSDTINSELEKDKLRVLKDKLLELDIHDLTFNDEKVLEKLVS
jgi:hypothetical protein